MGSCWKLSDTETSSSNLWKEDTKQGPNHGLRTILSGAEAPLGTAALGESGTWNSVDLKHTEDRASGGWQATDAGGSVFSCGQIKAGTLPWSLFFGAPPGWAETGLGGGLIG